MSSRFSGKCMIIRSLHSLFIRYADLCGILTFRKYDHSPVCLLMAAYKYLVLLPRKNQIILYNKYLLFTFFIPDIEKAFQCPRKLRYDSLQIVHGKECTHIDTCTYTVEMFKKWDYSIFMGTRESLVALPWDIWFNFDRWIQIFRSGPRVKALLLERTKGEKAQCHKKGLNFKISAGFQR